MCLLAQCERQAMVTTRLAEDPSPRFHSRLPRHDSRMHKCAQVCSHREFSRRHPSFVQTHYSGGFSHNLQNPGKTTAFGPVPTASLKLRRY
jgi:hypothetical protein